ncbi:MAG: FlgD immunoglobulin-like domain containing protein, partial [Nocardioides sp.]
MIRRLLASLLVAASVISPILPGVASAEAPTQQALKVEIVSGHGWLSPNGDGHHDRSTVSFDLSERADVRVQVLAHDRVIRGSVKLGRLAGGVHRWTWDGRDNRGHVVPDGSYRVEVRATRGSRSVRDAVRAGVDTVADRGSFRLSGTVVRPAATVVHDRISLVYLRHDWGAVAAAGVGTSQPVRAVLQIRDAVGGIVSRQVVKDRYTPSFEWDARVAEGSTVFTGEYVAELR